MELKTFQARTMTDALSKVKRDLGREAMILHTRTIKRGGVLGIGARNFVEITATVDPRVMAARSAAPPEEHPLPASLPRVAETTTPDKAQQAAIVGDDVREELTAIRSMVRDLLRQAPNARSTDVPADLLEHYTRLIGHEVAESIATEIIDRVRQRATEKSDAPTSSVQTREALAEYITELLPPAAPLELVAQDRPTIVAFVGPTGVGKTTTLAKLAAHMKIREGRSVGLITIDSYRIAAVEQLRTYAEILQVPLHPVGTPQEMVDAIQQLAAVDLILIDTAGRSQKDEPRITELKQFLDAARPDQVHLVLATTAREAAIRQAVERFGALGARQLIFTKLDEAVGFGVILNVLRSFNLRLSYLTTGQSVPDDIEVGSARRVAELILSTDEPGASMAAGSTSVVSSDAPSPTQRKKARRAKAAAPVTEK